MNDPLPITDDLVIPAECLAWEVMRAGGPGGQHVNTAETAVRLRFDLAGCPALSDAVKARLRARHRVTDAGEILIASGSRRSRLQNVGEARARLAAMVRDALVEPTERRATKPSRASQRRRVETKKKRSETKRLRGRVED